MFTVQLNRKYGAVVLYRAWVRTAFPDEVALGDGVWLVRKLPFPVPNPWREWLGSIQSRQIEESNLLVVSRRASKNPAVVDNENRTLSTRAQRLFLALLLLGPLRYEAGFVVSGGNPSGEVEFRQFGRLDLYSPSQDMPDFYVDLNAAHEAKRISQNLWSIYRGRRFLRVRTGLRIFWLGLQQKYAQDRLHQFVRSLDTIVKGGNREDFAARCQVFLGSRRRIEGILRECYTLRSVIEHESWNVAMRVLYPGRRTQRRRSETRLMLRTKQIEHICRQVYLRLVTSIQHRHLFINDASINRFWRLSDVQQKHLWGAPVQLLNS